MTTLTLSRAHRHGLGPDQGQVSFFFGNDDMRVVLYLGGREREVRSPLKLTAEVEELLQALATRPMD